ncbi:MAG: hypothetical protein AB1631_13395, partial [Acidobacteriota bacterium]
MTEQVIKQKIMPFGFLVIAAMTLTTGYWMKGTLPTQNPLLASDTPLKVEDETPKKDDAAPSQPKEISIKYQPFIVQGAKSIAELKAKIGEDGFN